MAARLKEELQLEAQTVVGKTGEFTVWVDGKKVAEKTFWGFPEEDECVERVRDALGMA